MADLGPGEALDLWRSGAVHVLDVREPAEFIQSHIPGAILVPLRALARRLGELDPGARWLVHCEHGIRSVRAARMLSEAGFTALCHLRGGLSGWTGPREDRRALFSDPKDLTPSPWLRRHLARAPRGWALDLAAGGGRNALLMASEGFHVLAVDRDAERLAAGQQRGAILGSPFEIRVVDLEGEAGPGQLFPEGAHSLVGMFRYLHRPLLPRLARALAPGGLLLIETFLDEQRERGRPSIPDWLLRPGELLEFAGAVDLEVVESREGLFPSEFPAGVDRHAGVDNRIAIASLVARRSVGRPTGG